MVNVQNTPKQLECDLAQFWVNESDRVHAWKLSVKLWETARDQGVQLQDGSWQVVYPLRLAVESLGWPISLVQSALLQCMRIGLVEKKGRETAGTIYRLNPVALVTVRIQEERQLAAEARDLRLEEWAESLAVADDPEAAKIKAADPVGWLEAVDITMHRMRRRPLMYPLEYALAVYRKKDV